LRYRYCLYVAPLSCLPSKAISKIATKDKCKHASVRLNVIAAEPVFENLHYHL
jgi:hypothetical protein